MVSENEKRKDDIYSTTCFSVFPFFHLAKEKTKICITDPISIFFVFCLLIKKKEKDTSVPFSYFLS